MPFSLIPFVLLVIPLAEIAAFVVIGGQIGVFATLAMIVVTAIIGSILLRVQGFSLITRIQAETDAGRIPGRELVHGVMILIAGVLLLTPGFITDTLGFLLFVPALRDLGWTLVRNRITVVSAGGFSGRQAWRGEGRRTIDLGEDEYRDEDTHEGHDRR
ncbi:MAG: FxsA family protein [Zhengella sp.]|nr:membrane protein FxsA [Notoacmeibacter sp.]